MSLEQKIEADARLRILQALAGQTDNRLSDRMLVYAIEPWGHRKSIDFVRTQLHALAEVGAVTLPSQAESGLIAELTVAGREHIERRRVISGVKRPDPGE